MGEHFSLLANRVDGWAAVQCAEQSEQTANPKDDHNDHQNVYDGLDFRVHRNVSVHQPKQNADDDEDYYKLNQWHLNFPFWYHIFCATF
jgi:hypothetical protein